MTEFIIDGIKFSDKDVVEIDDWIPLNEYNPHNVRPWLLHDNGFVLCIVFASCLQDALDKAVDEDKLDRYLVPESERDAIWENEEHEGIAFLGNAGEPFDIEGLDYRELVNPARSWVAQFAQHVAPGASLGDSQPPPEFGKSRSVNGALQIRPHRSIRLDKDEHE